MEAVLASFLMGVLGVLGFWLLLPAIRPRPKHDANANIPQASYIQINEGEKKTTSPPRLMPYHSMTSSELREIKEPRMSRVSKGADLSAWMMKQKPEYSDCHSKYHIMICDDDNISITVVRGCLFDQEYLFEAVHSGPELLQWIANSATLPDIILMDINIPGMSGIEVILKLRENHSSARLPIIMMTCNMDENTVHKAFEAGCNDYMIKPVNRVELIIRIRTQLALKRALQIEMDSHYNRNLLCNILPKNILDKIKDGDPILNQYHESVTILFTDIVGFTTIASNWQTDRLIGMLNDMFTAFDNICESYGVYKVETIGDAYMIASGHDGTKDHAFKLMLVAEALIDAVHKLGENWQFDGEPIKIRMGVHTGPAHSGIVGVTRPRYCFFGDTVNVASRMESTGYPMIIHLSEATYNVMCEENEGRRSCFLSMGIKHIKGKGLMKHFVMKDRWGNWQAVVNEQNNEYTNEFQNSDSSRKLDLCGMPAPLPTHSTENVKSLSEYLNMRISKDFKTLAGKKSRSQLMNDYVEDRLEARILRLAEYEYVSNSDEPS